MGFSSSDPRNYFAFAKQADASTEATTGFKFLKYLGDTQIDLNTETETVYEGGDGQDPGLVYLSKVKADGQAVANVRPDMWTYLSAWALGSAVAVGTAVGVGTSIYVPNATVPYLTIEQAWGGGNQIDRAVSCILTGFQIEAEAGMPWKVTVPFIGGAGGSGIYYRDGAVSGGSALSAVLESGDPAMYSGGAYLISAATQLDVLRWTYNFERTVDDELFTNSVYRRKIVPLARSVSLDMSIIHQNASLYHDLQYGGGSFLPANLATMSFHAERILTGSQMVAVDVPYLRVTNVGINRLEPDGQTVVLDVSAVAVKNAATALTFHRSTHASGITASSYL